MSALAHAAIIAALVGGTGLAASPEAREKFDSFLQFLLPPDRARSLGDEHVAFVGVGQIGSPKGEERGEPIKVEAKNTAQGDPVIPQQATESAQMSGILQLAEAARFIKA